MYHVLPLICFLVCVVLFSTKVSFRLFNRVDLNIKYNSDFESQV
jgi:hypothetical protein